MSLDDQLHRAGARLNAELEMAPIPETPRRRSAAWRTALVTAVLTVLIGSSVLWFVRGSDSQSVSISESASTTSTTTTSITDGSQIPGFIGVSVIAEGTFDGADKTWLLTASFSDDEGLCMQLQGNSCGPAPGPSMPLTAPSGTTNHLAEPQQACVYGAIHSDVAEVTLTFSDSSTLNTPIHNGRGLPANFYAYCWAGERTFTSVTVFDTDGDTLATAGEVTEPAPTTTQAATPTEPLFGETLPWVLLFDDGIDGVLAIDPNNRIGSRSVIEGQGAGDSPYRLELTNQRLIVGSGEIYSTDPETRQSTPLGPATIYLPAAEPARVWLIDYPSGRIQGTPTAWQVSAVTGAQLTDPTPIDIDGFPAVGIRGGLAIETDNGIALWDAETATITTVLGTGPAFVADASPDVDTRLAWCQDTCTDLHITNLESDKDLIVTHPDGTSAFDARSARFSNDRRFLAAPAGADVVVVDLETETATVGFSVESGTEPYLFVSWAPSGPDLFASTYSYGQESTTIVHHRALNGETTTATLPFGGALSFVVLNPNQGAAFLKDDPQTPADCPPTYVQPSGRVGICGFHF